jgi:hypothetical protein
VDIHHYYDCFDLVLDSRSTGPFARADDYDQIYAASLECPWSGGEKRFRGAYAYLGSDNPAGDNASGCLCHALGIGGSRCGTEGVSRVHTFIGAGAIGAGASADYFANRVIPATLFVCATESTHHGSLSRFFPADMPAVH